MNENQICAEIEQQLAAYALEALEPAEWRIVDTHLAQCDKCRSALAEYQIISEGIALSTPVIEPSARLRARLIAALGAQSGDPAPTSRTAGLPWRWGAGLAVGLMLVVNGYLALQTRGLARQQKELTAQLQADQVALGLAAYPTRKTAVVQGDEGYGALVYEPYLEVSILYAWDLEPLESDYTYQAWLIKPDGTRVSAGLFQATADQAFVQLVIHAPGPLHDYVGFGVTIEPQGGSPAPTGPRIMGTDL
jgi:anti-sigma-K factor RskA